MQKYIAFVLTLVLVAQVVGIWFMINLPELTSGKVKTMMVLREADRVLR